MRCRVKLLRLVAGRPVVFINEKDARSLDVMPGKHVVLTHQKKSVIAIADIASRFIPRGIIGLSSDTAALLGKQVHSVKIEMQKLAESSALLRKKLKCEPYTKAELKIILSDIIKGHLTEAEVAHFVSGVYHCGMSLKETADLCRAMLETGSRITWPDKVIADKHSIGGIAGNRTTPIVVAICSAAGVMMPKTSSRAITSAAGTADVIEAIARVNFSLKEMESIVNKVGACLAWGGALALAPADDKLIQVEKQLNLDPEPQLLASILSKKLSVGSTHVVIDIPYGPGAKVSRSQGLHLANKFKALGSLLGLKIQTVLTDGKQPIGKGIGPMLEMRDVLAVLRRDNAPLDLEKKSLVLSGILLELTGKVKKGSGLTRARELLNSGAAYHQFKEIIGAQSGSVDRLRDAPHTLPLLATHTGTITAIHNRTINLIARLAGSPDDKVAGLYLHHPIGTRVTKGTLLLTIHAQSKNLARNALEYAKREYPLVIE